MRNPVEIIARKRDGHELPADAIAEFVSGYVAGRVPEYQMAALSMAVYFRGLSDAETAALTEAMLRSGQRLAWPTGGPATVDKHSTGGIGDKVSLVLAPLLACCGLQVPMISGRGLGPTGGTLDKLESIPGFRTDLTLPEIRRTVERVGCVITGATSELVPADRKLYALRDVTATVPAIGLITASIMSKKLAEGLDALVLDVKFGSGAFMKSIDEARRLARSLVGVGTRMGLKTTALLSDMNQPLGRMAGNAVEVNEAVDALSGKGPQDLVELVLALGAELLVATEAASDESDARVQLAGQIDSGRALEKFREMVAAQGGDLDVPRPLAPTTVVSADAGGCVTAIDTEALGLAVIELGGGRRQVDQPIDHSVGLEMLVRLGEQVERGTPLVRVFGRDGVDVVCQRIVGAVTIGNQPPSMGPLIAERITVDS